MEITLLPTTYLGNIEYYAHLVNEQCLIECCNSYEKQTYANRCRIMTAGGVMDLTVPIAKPWHHVMTKDVRIAYDEDWRNMHWRAIRAAYGSSPFFEFYADELAEIYQQRWVFLIDFDRKLEQTLLHLMKLDDIKPSYTEEWFGDENKITKDLRNVLHPKKNFVPLHINLGEEYYQVFTPEFGFVKNLSALDLLMNLGNESRIYLRKIYKQ